MKYYVVLFLFFISLSVHADTHVGGFISEDTHWSPSSGVYILDDNVTVPAGVTLNIDPGTTIKARGNVGLLIEGELVARGINDNKIIFTSLLDDVRGGDTNADATSSSPLAGDWQGITFESDAKGSFDNVEVYYAGYNGFSIGYFSGIRNNGGNILIEDTILDQNNWYGIHQIEGSLSVSNSTISNNLLGIYVEGGAATVNNSAINDNSEIGIQASAIKDGSISLFNNIFSNNQSTAVIDVSLGFVHIGNVSYDVTNRGFRVYGSVKKDTTLDSGDLPLLITGGIEVVPHQTLTLAPGTVIKLGDSLQKGDIVVKGNLVAEGTANLKIYLTSIKDDSIGGDTNGDGSTSAPAAKDWTSLFFEEGSGGSFKNAVIKYGGYAANGEYLSGVSSAIYNRGANLSFDSSLIGHNAATGIFQDNGTTTITHTELLDESIGLQFRGGSAIISESSFDNHLNRAIYNENSITSAPTQIVDARHNWWGSDSGPQDTSTTTPTGSGESISGGVLYVPWLTTNPFLPVENSTTTATTTPARVPVIIVPGIMASYLSKEGLISADTEVWMNTLKMTLSLEDLYLYDLALSYSGESIQGLVIKPTDIVQLVDVPLFRSHFFDYLITTIKHNGYLDEKDLFVFPYDWRLDIETSASKLKEKIEEVKIKTGASKVDLVGHSMGGILVKKYLKDTGGVSVNKFIDIATPHSGSPNAFNILSFGNTAINIFDRKTAKNISQNMPAIYELLPSQNYLNQADDNYKYYVFDGINKNNRLSFDQTKTYLKDSGRNAALVDRANTFHQEVDNLNPADYGVKAFNIVGCGIPTIGQFYILDKDEDGHVYYNIKMINGDGTVPLRSAEAIAAEKTYYVKGIRHAVISSADGVKELVASLLISSTTPDGSAYENISSLSSDCSLPGGVIVSFHSPVDLHVYDESRNHDGPTSNGDVEENIPGATYEVIEDNKFSFLPGDSEYEVIGKATGNGMLAVRIEDFGGEKVTKTTLFNDIPVKETTIIKFKVRRGLPTIILIDADGDGVFEATKEMTGQVDGFLESNKIEKKPVPSPVPIPPLSNKEEESLVRARSKLGGRRHLLEESTTTEVVVMRETQSTSRAVVRAKPKENKIIEVPTTSESNTLQNTAAVYNSWGRGFGDVFKRMWIWIKSNI
jgi:hypothetical protein